MKKNIIIAMVFVILSSTCTYSHAVTIPPGYLQEITHIIHQEIGKELPLGTKKIKILEQCGKPYYVHMDGPDKYLFYSGKVGNPTGTRPFILGFDKKNTLNSIWIYATAYVDIDYGDHWMGIHVIWPKDLQPKPFSEFTLETIKNTLGTPDKSALDMIFYRDDTSIAFTIKEDQVIELYIGSQLYLPLSLRAILNRYHNPKKNRFPWSKIWVNKKMASFR